MQVDEWQVRELHDFTDAESGQAWTASGDGMSVDAGSMQVALGRDGYESVTKEIP